MSTPLVVTDTQARMRLPTLRTVMIAGLLGNVVVNTVLQALILQVLIPPLAIIMALTLVVAGVCATHWRWAAHLAVLWCVLSVVPGLEPYTYDLTHPAETGNFILTLLSLVLLLVTVVAGVAAMIYGDRQVAEGRAPRWLTGFLIGIATFVLGASLVAAIPPSDATAGVSAEALAQLPALVRRVRCPCFDTNRRAGPGALHTDHARHVYLLLPHPRSPGSRHGRQTDRRAVGVELRTWADAGRRLSV